MKFVYAPEGVDPREWDFDPGKMMNPEAEAIERDTGMTFKNWVDAVMDESTTAVHALLWVLLKRQDPTLRYEQVQFAYDDWDFTMSREEKIRVRDELLARLRAGLAVTDEQRELLDDLQAELADVPVDESTAPTDDTPAGQEQGKDPGPALR